MPLNFQSRLGAAYDAASGITIPEPRTLLMTMPDGSPGTGYQYAFYQNGRRIGCLGVWGHNTTINLAGREVTLLGLELFNSQMILSMLKPRASIEDPEDHLRFLFGMARGLVKAHTGKPKNACDLRYVALTTVDTLIKSGFVVPNPEVISRNGNLVLAEETILSTAGRDGSYGQPHVQ